MCVKCGFISRFIFGKIAQYLQLLYLLLVTPRVFVNALDQPVPALLFSRSDTMLEIGEGRPLNFLGRSRHNRVALAEALDRRCNFVVPPVNWWSRGGMRAISLHNGMRGENDVIRRLSRVDPLDQNRAGVEQIRVYFGCGPVQMPRGTRLPGVDPGCIFCKCRYTENRSSLIDLFEFAAR